LNIIPLLDAPLDEPAPPSPPVSFELLPHATSDDAALAKTASATPATAMADETLILPRLGDPRRMRNMRAVGTLDANMNALELALLFLRLGLTAFGGPAAHVAIMEHEVVRRRQWMTRERFLDLLGVANLLPGPSSTELAIFIGYERAGAAGLALAGACFILPAALLVTALGWAYVRFGAVPRVEGALYGIKPVVIAVIAQALWRLAPRALRGSPARVLVAALAGAGFVVGVDPIVVLLGGGALSLAFDLVRRGERLSAMAPPLVVASAAATATAPVTLGALFLVFLKIGATVFGSGYVLLAFLRADLVDRLGWLSEAQLLDAVAVGQVTPGPVFTTATFIGYLVAGPAGAAVATVAIFLPSFFLVAVSRPLVARVRAHPLAGAFLDGVTAASLALMAVAGVELARAALIDAPTEVLALLSAVAIIRFEINATWVVAAGAAIGIVAKVVH
jgi:chromate transporter